MWSYEQTENDADGCVRIWLSLLCGAFTAPDKPDGVVET